MRIRARERQLLDNYCSGHLTDAEFEELENALRENSELRKLLIEYRGIESGLRNIASEESEQNRVNSSKQSRERFRWVEVYAIAATVVFLLGSFIFAFRNAAERETVSPVGYAGFAILTRETDAEWSGHQPQKGDSLSAGLWNLSSGIAEMEFFSGASVILQGPASLEIISGNEAVLHSGKLNAEIPPHAYGFMITSADVKLVDLGTAFAMEASGDTGTSVHVFEGKVVLHDVTETGSVEKTGEELVAGEGRIVTGNGMSAVIQLDDSRFIRASAFDQLQETQEQERLNKWRLASRKLRNDSRLVAYYNFETQDTNLRRLDNHSGLSDPGLNGSIIGAQWSEGRWTGKRSLEFKRPGDRVRIAIPDQYESLTFACWLRLDAFDQRFHSILHSDGWTRPGTVHWHINETGFMAIGVWDGDNTQYNLSADLQFRPSDYGRWMHLAVTYDGADHTVGLYRDGVLLNRIEISHSVNLDIGNAEIGNWSHLNRGEGSDLVRNFNGRIDEFLIMKEALSGEEIKSLCSAR